MNSICCKSAWCNCGCFDQYSDKPPCADKKQDNCCCKCCCCDCGGQKEPIRRCCELPVEPFGQSCGCFSSCNH